MASAYSERLVVVSAEGWSSWTVPLGHRAVVRTATSATYVTAAAAVEIWIAGAPQLLFSHQVLKSSRVFDVRLVAYGGEAVQIFQSAIDVITALHGYIFKDDSQRMGPLTPPDDPASVPPGWTAG